MRFYGNKKESKKKEWILLFEVSTIEHEYKKKKVEFSTFEQTKIFVAVLVIALGGRLRQFW